MENFKGIFSNILVGIDGSNDSLEGMYYAMKIAESMGSKLTFLYVITENYIKEVFHGEEEIKKSKTQVDDLLLLQSRTEQIGKAVFQKVETYIKTQNPDLQFEFKMIEGNPKDVFVKEINENEYDLCVLGSGSASKSFTAVFGRVSDYIIQNTKTPILIIHR
jgi:nucleotide-binding universal stress UspA family protein